VIVPLFALANVGVDVSGSLIADAIRSPITLGILAGSSSANRWGSGWRPGSRPGPRCTDRARR